MVFVMLTVGFSFLSPFKNKKWNILYKVICYILATFFFIAISFFHFGFANSFEQFLFSDKYMCLLEHYEHGDDMESVYMLHVVDLQTGDRLNRKYMSYSCDINSISGNYILLRKKQEYFLKNYVTQKDSIIYNKEFFKSHFNVFSSGINKIDYQQIIFGNQKIDALQISANNGFVYFFDYKANKLYTSDEINRAYNNETDSIQISNYEIYYKQHTLFALAYKSGTDNVYYLTDKNKNQISDKLFIYAQFVGFSKDLGIMFIQSFETVQKYEYILTAVKIDGNILWNFKSADIKRYKANKYEAKMDFFKPIGNNVYFNINGLVVCLDAISGQIIWKTQL